MEGWRGGGEGGRAGVLWNQGRYLSKLMVFTMSVFKIFLFCFVCVCVCVCVYDAQKVLLGAAWLYQHVVSSQTICRFLLGRHKAALDTYAEALTLNPHDWVCGQGMNIASYPARLGEEERVC